MKQLLILLVLSFCLSCSLDDTNEQQTRVEVLPITAVEYPDTFSIFNNNTIVLNFTLPNQCYIYRDIYYSIDNNTRTIAILTEVVLNNTSCETSTNIESQTAFNFQPDHPGMYTLKFWLGDPEDTGLSQEYYIVEVEVTN